MGTVTFIFSFLIVMHTSAILSESLTLSTKSRWIVDQSTQKRVKLSCVNWASHLQPMIAEGLEKQPLESTVAQVVANGFNCVRFTWPTFMFNRPDYYNRTVAQSLDRNNLTAAKAGIAEHNPRFADMALRDAHEAVVNEFGRQKLMVVLDNHVSKPDWCCSDHDGNGFFNDTNFDTDEWLRGLAEVARRYKNNSAVVGMSLRNELRGSRQNELDWYKYIKLGAETVHNESLDFLVIVSGLSSASNLRFLKTKPLNVTLDDKLVYEAHWYTFGIPPSSWTNQTNTFCKSFISTANSNFLYLLKSFPLFLSEYGKDERGGNEGQNRYFTCLLTEMAGKDIDSALWTFQGSYMYREGKVDMEEFYGVMNKNWTGPRNKTFVDRLQIIQQMNQGSIADEADNTANNYTYTMFHPESGLCVHIDDSKNVSLSSCKNASRWERHRDGDAIKLAGTSLCLTATRDGGATVVSEDCSENRWNYTRITGFQLAARTGQGMYMCLEKDASDDDDTKVVTKKCLCVGGDLDDLPRCADNPQVQWFKFVLTND